MPELNINDLADKFRAKSVRINNFKIKSNKTELMDSPRLFNLYHNEYYLSAICETIDYLCDKRHVDIAENLLNGILNPRNNDGMFFEIMGYHWLVKNSIPFSPQVKICKEDCYKKDGYDADGIICNNIVFDIKTFGITTPTIDKLKRKFEDKLPDYIWTIGGNLGESNIAIHKNGMEKYLDIINDIDKYKCHDMYTIKFPDLDLELRAVPKDKYCSISSISEFNPYEWAEKNELYFFSDASQFTRNSPYIIFCLFDNENANHFHRNFANGSDISFRSLSRRVFMKLKNEANIELNNIDGKSLNKVFLSEVSRKLSAIVFIDSSQPQDNKIDNIPIWAYINPHADNPLYKHVIASLFSYNSTQCLVEEFLYDTY